MNPGPAQRRSNLVAWIVIAAVSLLFIAQPWLDRGGAGSEKLAAQAAVSAQQAIMTSLVNGMSAEPLRDASGPQLSGMRPQVESMALADDPGSELATAALLTRIGARDRALEMLTGLRDRVNGGEVEADGSFRATLDAVIELVDAAKEPGTRRIPEEACSRVVDSLGATGRMLVAQARGDRDELARLEEAGMLVIVALFAVGTVAFLLGLVGMAMLVVFLVAAATGRTAGIARQAGDWNHVYAEVFAAWLASYLLLSRVPSWAFGWWKAFGGATPSQDVQLLASVAATVVAAAVGLWWGTVRGLPLRTLLDGIGLRRFAAMDLVWGVVTWSMGIVLLVVGIAMAFLLSALFGDGGMQASHPIQQLVQDSGGLGLLLTYALACVSAPLFEEIFFRGAMYRNLRIGLGRWGALGSAAASMLVSSVIFAAIHPQGLVFIPVLAGLALAFCIMREWRGSINASIVAHAINNGVILTLNVLMMRG